MFSVEIWRIWATTSATPYWTTVILILARLVSTLLNLGYIRMKHFI